MTSKERAYLKSLANKVPALYQIGKDGLGENMVKQIDDALTAREVGKRLSTSSSPIFTVFRDMDELRCAVRTMAKARFDGYMAVAENYVPAYNAHVR